jgi:hypothetical protein
VFTLDSWLIHNPSGLAQALHDSGVFFAPKNLKLVQDYMSLYTQDLQRRARAEHQFGHLGWIDAKTRFVLHDKIINQDGSESPVFLRPGVRSVLVDRHGMGRKGTLDGQIKVLEFYNKPKYAARQFMILAALASPLYHAFGLAGSIIHANGITGAAKSMALSGAMSLWGHPILGALNALKVGSTVNFRNELIGAMCNLPVGLDEITDIADDVAKEFALGVSQAQPRKGRLKQSGDMAPSTGGDKSGLILTTANVSLHGVLSRSNIAGNAGAMRVFEMPFEVFEDEPDAARQFRYDILDNFGHIGEAFMKHVLPNYDRVLEAYRSEQTAFDKLAKWRPNERFWSADCAAVLATARLAKQLGLLPYDPEPIIAWLLTEQLPLMRGSLVDQYPSSTEVITSYINTLIDNMVIIPDGNVNVLKEPRGVVKARYESDNGRMWLSRDAFRHYCDIRNAPYMQYMHELSVARIVTSRTERKVLTSGTTLTTARTWCFVVNMQHDDMKDLAPKLEPAKQVGKPVLTVIKSDKI